MDGVTLSADPVFNLHHRLQITKRQGAGGKVGIRNQKLAASSIFIGPSPL